MGKPKAPKAPDPNVVAAAQTGTNVSTAVANQIGAMVGQNTPDGSLSFDQTGTFSFTDPSSGQVYELPRFTANQTLTPSGQAQADQNNMAELNLATLARYQSANLLDHMWQKQDTEGLPAAGGNPTAPNLRTTIDDAGAITRTYGTDFSQDRQRVEDALMARMNPQIERDREALRTQLVNQGINIGSEAYTRAKGDFGQNVNDARMGAILAGGQEQSRLVGMEADRAAFQNAAQNQQFGQNTVGAQFENDARQQMFGNAMAGAQRQDGMRNQALQEQFAMRNQPINEITALLSGSQVSQPNFVTAPGLNMPTTDYAGLVGQNYAGQMASYQQQMAGRNSMLGGLFGLGAGALTGAGAAKGFSQLFR